MQNSKEAFNNIPRETSFSLDARYFDKPQQQITHKPHSFVARMRGIEDLIDALVLREKTLTLKECYLLVREYKDTISLPQPDSPPPPINIVAQSESFN